MTTKRDSKSKPKKARPKLTKEKLKDLNPSEGAGVKGGAQATPYTVCFREGCSL